MANIEGFIPHLGTTAANPALKNLIEASGLKPLKLNTRADAGRIDSVNKKQGCNIVYKKREGKLAKGYFDRFLFTTIFFYNENGHGYSQFSGTLPFQIKFDDDRSQILDKIGIAPSFIRFDWQEKDVIAMDRWDFETYSLAIDYWDNGKTISTGIVMSPWLRRDELWSSDYVPRV